MVSKGQFVGLDWNRITRLHSQVMIGTQEVKNSLTASRCHLKAYPRCDQYPSNDDLISVFVNMYVTFCDRLQVWKLVWILEVRSENGCGKWHLLVWNRVGIWRTGPHIPPNPRFLGVQPPPTTPRCYWHFWGGGGLGVSCLCIWHSCSSWVTLIS